ncbi:MamI family restriction endonuclease [Tenacibaculum finnmarkense]|uniref:MamI family restriction endonuclease n=1 Tax=Tenacibaculum finnmarkense TaxID=2781243 RepID=UPI003BB54A9D
MKPEAKYITISDNQNRIEQLLMELVLEPRIKALVWSQITRQTPNMKIGYPGQHLASLITGVEGSRTGARGDDLIDGTEVKSCSRVDQLDSCKDCKQKVLRIEKVCPHCGSAKIKRMDDSKWLFSVKSEAELKLLTQHLERVFLTIADYPNFAENDFDTIRFQAFEMWNNTERHKHFSSLMTNYYHKIFLEHISRNANKTPAPKNFWPYSYQFYLCNPVKVFDCVVTNANTSPQINITHLVEPNFDRSLLIPEAMPTILLSQTEIDLLIDKVPEYVLTSQIIEGSDYKTLIKNKNSKKKFSTILPFINELTRGYLDLRDTDKVAEAKTKYSRR